MSGPYQVIMCDPPWPLGSTFDTNRDSSPRVAASYGTMTEPALWALLDEKVLSQAAPSANLFLWTLDRFLVSCDAEMTQRGWRRHARFIWDKGAKGMSPCATVRICHEYMVWYYRPRLVAVAKEAQAQYTTLIRAAPRGHSRKPGAAYALVEALYPDARKLDAFTREYRPGWDGFGDQRDHFTPLLAGLREQG